MLHISDSENKNLKKAWKRVSPVLSDFFEFIIGNLLKGVFSETFSSFKPKTLFIRLKEEFLRFWKMKFIQYFKTKKEISLNQSKFKEKLKNILEERFKFSHFHHDFIINTISNLNLDLYELFSVESFRSNSEIPGINKKFLKYLKNLIEENIIVTYFDQIILGSSLKIVFNSENLTFAQIYRIRIQTIEIFRDFLYSTNKFKEMQDFFSKLREKNHIGYSINFVENFIMSFMISVAENKSNWSDIITECKKKLKKRTKLISNNLIIPITGSRKKLNKIEPKVEVWIEDQVTTIIENDNLLKIDEKGILSKILLKHLNRYIINPKSSYSIKKLIKNEFKDYILKQITQNGLLDLTEFILYHKSLDPTLEYLNNIIDSTEKETISGGNDYFI